MFRGTVLADETWIGGNPKNRHADDKREPVRKFSTTDMQPIMAVMDFEYREVRSRVIADVTGKTLETVLNIEVDVEHSQLWTDEAKGHIGVGKPLNSHHTVNHSAGQYKRHGATRSAVEGYFSQLKRSVDGTHHAVSVEHLDGYLAQFDWMYTNCKAKDSERIRELTTNVDGRRLTMQMLIGNEGWSWVLLSTSSWRDTANGNRWLSARCWKMPRRSRPSPSTGERSAG